MYRDFTKWLFDGNLNSPIPNEQEMLKYNSPIKHNYILQCLLPHPKLTIYLNELFNNYNLYSLDKKEFMLFIKKLIISLNITKNYFNYKVKRNNEKNDLYLKLLKKLPQLKKYDVLLLTEIINNLDSNKKNSYYSAVGLDKPKKKKLTKNDKKQKSKNLSLKNYIRDNFTMQIK